MSSIFTYDPSPSHPLSPWDTPPPREETPQYLQAPEDGSRSRSVSPILGISSLVSESELGSTEYKLTLAGGHKSSERFEQLTTQLLWRLQQSSPYHGSSGGTDIASPEAIAATLQESQGALYEIGIADDGSFVGLDDEKLQESLECLQKMAARLGCGVQVLRKVEVRRQYEEVSAGKRYWVVEAFVKPSLGSSDGSSGSSGALLSGVPGDNAGSELLRVAFIGASGAGKSTLLGSLVTGSLDNGRGKSRMSLFRHRHELVSGITSSLLHEIIGYRPAGITNDSSQVILDKTPDHSSWADICAAASSAGGRVVVGTDSAGLPRYRRTVLRGLIGWDPHYALFLVSAEAGENADSVNLSMEYLRLLLKLGVPFLVIVTKVDAATKQSIHASLAPVVGLLKKNGRQPSLLNPAQPADTERFEGWNATEQKKAEEISQNMRDRNNVVPILFTSSVKGNGITMLHALLANLPILDDHERSSLSASELPLLFQIDEVFSLQGSASTLPMVSQSSHGAIASGYVRHGAVSVGEDVLVGPFEVVNDGEASKDSPKASSEWLRFRVTSARRLRSPVHGLKTWDVGSIGLVLLDNGGKDEEMPPLRKGMVVVACGAAESQPPESARTVTAKLKKDELLPPLTLGSQVVLYNGFVRAAAEVVAVESGDEHESIFRVSLKLFARREWVGRGSKLYVIPGGGKSISSAGLEGFVGEIEGICH